MKKLIFLIFECPISVLGFCQLNTYNIKVEINGIGNDTVYVMYYPLSNAEETHTDTLLANGNRFTYKLPINQPAAVALIPQKSFYKRMGGGLYVPATKFIVLVVKPTDRLKIQGTLNKDYLDYKI